MSACFRDNQAHVEWSFATQACCDPVGAFEGFNYSATGYCGPQMQYITRSRADASLR